MSDKTLDSVVSEFLVWAKKTFPRSTRESCLAHLKREIDELSQVDSSPFEIADCIMLLFDMCQRAGYDTVELLRQKLEINKKRKWGEADSEGVVEHVRHSDKPSTDIV